MISFIEQVFSQHLFVPSLSNTERKGMALRQSLLLYTLEDAIEQHQAPSRLFELIENLPNTASLDEKLAQLNRLLTKYAAMPVITVHPTNVLSNEALFKLTKLSDDCMQLYLGNISDDDLSEYKSMLTSNIIAWATERLVPKQNLRPEAEANYALFLYQRILASFPKFKKEVVDKFVDKHGGDKLDIANSLNKALTKSYKNIFSWCMADFDGNHNRTRKTIAITLPSQQHAILDMYIASIDKIIAKMQSSADFSNIIDKLQDTNDFFKRCVRAIDAGIWFDLKGSQKTAKRCIINLENYANLVVLNKTELSNELAKELLALRDLIAMAGFFGGLKEYTRQTTQLNQRVLDELFAILIKHHPNIYKLLNNQTYSNSNVHVQYQALELLRKEPKYFEALKQNQFCFCEETKRELDRLSFILEHRDLFPSYITSDTHSKINFDEVLMLLRLASFLNGSLCIGQIREHALNSLALCESPKDIENFSNIIQDMFDDQSVKNRIKESQFFSYVGGPSDLGKQGGILVYLSLLRVVLQSESVLEQQKQADPELSKVRLRILHGFGGDLKRRNGSSGNELHSTQQGIEAWWVLGNAGAYEAFLHRVVGQPSETYCRAQEVLQLKQTSKVAYDALVKLEKEGIGKYQLFIKSDANKKLLLALTSLPLEKKLNISSRAGTKTDHQDPTNVRAIGVVNLYLITGIQWDVFMSLLCVFDMPQEVKRHFSIFFNQLTVIKDIVYKTIFTIAVSDMPSAFAKLKVNNDEYQTLTFIQDCAEKILGSCFFDFIAINDEPIVQELKYIMAKPIDVNIKAMLMMQASKDEALIQLYLETKKLLPHYQNMLECVAAFEEKQSDKRTENAILACRALPLASGPRMIANLHAKVTPVLLA